MSKPQPQTESKPATVADPKTITLSGWLAVMAAKEMTPAIFTRHELELLRKVCRDSDYEDATKVLARAVQRGDGRGAQ